MKARIKVPNPGTTFHQIKGAQCNGSMIFPRDLAVRITSDEHGKSLSISDDDRGMMFMIPLEPILSRLKEVVQ